MVWGRWIYAVGGEPKAAVEMGIPVKGVLVSAYVISGLCAGIGAVVLSGRTAASSPLYGNLLELDTIAAVIIGGASFLGGRGHVGHALVGAVMIGVIRNALNLLNVDIFFQMIAIGLVIVVAVEADVLRNYLEVAGPGASGGEGPMSTATPAPPVLVVRHAQKRFGAVHALKDVSLEAYGGEVLALLGDNGAGKSTLVKCISGVHALDEGEIAMDGETVSIHSPAAARRAGIETVYQDLALFNNMTPAQNFYCGREIASPSWLPRALRFLNNRAMDREAADVLDRLKVKLPKFDAHVALMSGGQRQAIAVARYFHRRGHRGAGLADAAEGQRRRHIQRRDHRRRHLHLRHAAGVRDRPSAGNAPTHPRASDPRLKAFRKACTACSPIWPNRSRATAKARASWSRSSSKARCRKAPRAASPCRSRTHRW